MKKDFQAIQIIHASLCIGTLLFFVVVYFVLGTEEAAAAESDEIVFKYLPPVLVFSGIMLARFLDRSKLAAFKFPAEVVEKMVDYRTRVILRSALTEGPVLFVVIALMLTGDNLNILYFGIGWLAMLYFRPYVGEFSRDYKLTSQESLELR